MANKLLCTHSTWLHGIRIKSIWLEYGRLAVQEFVELVRDGKMLQAIKYARGYLAPWATVYLQELQVQSACLHNMLYKAYLAP